MIEGSRLEPLKTQKFELTQASRTHCSYVVHWSVPLTTRDSYHDPVPGAAPPTSDTRRRLLLGAFNYLSLLQMLLNDLTLGPHVIDT